MRELDSAKGYFLFSLDTELAWGYYDCFKWKIFSADGRRERQAIVRLLEVLDEFNITATWALVGLLFHERLEANSLNSSASWIRGYPIIAELARRNHPLLVGADMVATLLKKGKRHEIAFHGYSHRLFDEDQMSQYEAENEIQQWLEVSTSKNLMPQTVIFPQNKLGYLDLFRQYGFNCYRGEELVPKAYTLPLLGRVFKRLHHYLSAFYTPLVYEPEIDSTGLVNFPASRWLFGFNRKLDCMLEVINLNTLRLRKIAEGIKKAAREKKIIHLWAHPHEFQTEKDFQKLRFLLETVAEEVKAGRMQSVGMAELARQAIEQNQQMHKVYDYDANRYSNSRFA
jgi:hypothetical protein